jgi:hypothetical protein
MMDLEEARCAVRKWLELVQYHDWWQTGISIRDIFITSE